MAEIQAEAIKAQIPDELLDIRWCRSSEVVDARVEDDAVLMSVATAEYLFLNNSAAAVWDELSAPRSITELVEGLRARYSVDAQQCRHEVAELLLGLEARRVVARA